MQKQTVTYSLCRKRQWV